LVKEDVLLSATLRATRSDSRLRHILDAAAGLFCEKGFHPTSMRDIAHAVSMLPGSLYYHFASKEDVLVAVYEEGVRMISAAVSEAVARHIAPWERLEAACVRHLETLLGGSDYAQVVIRVLPKDVPGAAARLTSLRDSYEALFIGLCAALPLPRGAHRGTMRLMLLGALNWCPNWYRDAGLSPRSIARRFVQLLRTAQDTTGPAS
jgi:AcrR family transcriptional regulator